MSSIPVKENMCQKIGVEGLLWPFFLKTYPGTRNCRRCYNHETSGFF